jgi:hypothetical protein
MKREGKPKFKKNGGEEAMPEALPPPPNGDDQPGAKRDGKPKGKGKGKNRGGAPECPEGTMPLEDGSCAPIQ